MCSGRVQNMLARVPHRIGGAVSATAGAAGSLLHGIRHRAGSTAGRSPVGRAVKRAHSNWREESVSLPKVPLLVAGVVAQIPCICVPHSILKEVMFPVRLDMLCCKKADNVLLQQQQQRPQQQQQNALREMADSLIAFTTRRPSFANMQHLEQSDVIWHHVMAVVPGPQDLWGRVVWFWERPAFQRLRFTISMANLSVRLPAIIALVGTQIGLLATQVST